MQSFLDSIKLSLETKNWYAALAVALTIPDICGSIANPKEHSGPAPGQHPFQSL